MRAERDPSRWAARCNLWRTFGKAASLGAYIAADRGRSRPYRATGGLPSMFCPNCGTPVGCERIRLRVPQFGQVTVVAAIAASRQALAPGGDVVCAGWPV